MPRPEFLRTAWRWCLIVLLMYVALQVAVVVALTVERFLYLAPDHPVLGGIVLGLLISMVAIFALSSRAVTVAPTNRVEVWPIVTRTLCLWVSVTVLYALSFLGW